MSLERFPVRLKFFMETRSATDFVTNSGTANIWRGNDIKVDVGIYYKGAPLDLTNLASLTLEIKDKQNPTAAALASVTVNAADIDPTITDVGFQAGSEQNASFIFTSAQTNQNLNNSASRSFWFVLSGLTTAGRAITYGAVTLTIHEDNAGAGGTPPDPPENYYTSAEVDALLAVLEIEAARISDSTATGRSILTAANELAVKTLLDLHNVTNTADADKPVSGPQATALALKLDKTAAYTDLGTLSSGTAVLLINTYHKAVISGNITLSFGAATPVEGNFAVLRFTATTEVTLTIPSGTREGENAPITSLVFPAAEHVLIYERLGSAWRIADSASASSVAAHASTHGSGGSDEIIVAQGQVTGLVAALGGKASTSHTHVKADITDFSHTHTVGEITDFPHTHTVAEITDFPSYATIAENLSTNLKETIGVAVSDESTAITTGAGKVTFRMPYAMTLTGVRASLTTASSSGVVTVDINEGGVSILSTKLTIDQSEKTSQTAATPPVMSDTSLADDAEITIDIDTAGTGAAGLKVWLIGKRA